MPIPGRWGPASLALVGFLGGAFGALTWSTFVIYLLLAAGFGYVRFARPG
jgi:hypothetical protein